MSGTYDFVLRWTPESFQNAAGNAGPSRDGTLIFTALQEQLGLELESERGPVEFLVIDKVERTNPHAYLYLEAKDSAGKTTNWKVELGGSDHLDRYGWRLMPDCQH